MPIPVEISRFIDDIASTMLDDILESSSAEEMAQLIEELETKSGITVTVLDCERVQNPQHLMRAKSNLSTPF